LRISSHNEAEKVQNEYSLLGKKLKYNEFAQKSNNTQVPAGL